jgi:hypothetical protein
MYLMDMINVTAARIRTRERRIEPFLRAYLDLADRLVGTPRFILDADATRLFVELSLGRPKITVEALTHIRIPYRRMWVEFADVDRQRLRDRFTAPDQALQQTYSELRPMPGRVGFLIESDNGRAGTVNWAWSTPDGTNTTIPNVAAVIAHFDLDRQFPLDPDRSEGLAKGNLARLWEGNPVQLAALFDIWRTCQHRPTSWAPEYFAMLPNPALGEALSYADVVGEYITIWSVMLLLTASRPVVRQTPVNLAKLNKHRIRRKDLPLFDYTRVSLHLTPQEERPVVSHPLGFTRKSPRVHMVSSYLARRGSKHWIVAPYFRGSGETIHRVTRVHG